MNSLRRAIGPLSRRLTVARAGAVPPEYRTVLFPTLPAPTAELSIDSDFIWACGAAPEPVFDIEKNIDAGYALKAILVAIGSLTAFYQFIGLIPRENPAVLRIQKDAPSLSADELPEFQ